MRNLKIEKKDMMRHFTNDGIKTFNEDMKRHNILNTNPIFHLQEWL